VDVIEIGPDRQEELQAFLAKDPVQNLYALGILEEHGIREASANAPAFFGVLEDGRLVGAALVGGQGGLVNPCVFDPSVSVELGNALRGRVQMRGGFGERSAVDGLLRALGCGPARWSRPQRLFVASADDLGPFVCPELKRATLEDVPDLMQVGASAIRESLGQDPLGPMAPVFRRRLEARVAASRSFILREDKRIVVKVDVGVRSRYGAELEGLYPAPDARHRGLATLALGQRARLLLSSRPRLVMRVDEKDAGGAAVARKVGFTPMRPQRLVVLG